MRAIKQKQLNIRSDEAVARAALLAQRLGKTTTDVVVEALRSYEREVEPRDADGLTSGQRAEFEALRAIARRTADPDRASLPSDHSWLYDEHGLPK